MNPPAKECPTANGVDACGLVLVLRSSTGCHFGGDSMGRHFSTEIPWVSCFFLDFPYISAGLLEAKAVRPVMNF